MILETLPLGPLQANCTILGDEEAGEAIVIDPGLTLKQILLTHGHIDHVGGAQELKQRTGAPILLNENDLPMLKMIGEQATFFGLPKPETGLPDQYLSDGQSVGLERYPARVLCTPGHTQGSVCFYFASLNLLVAGDTLFAGSIGRTDLPGGSSAEIIDSIQTRLLTLPDETRVVAGHGPETTIGRERRSNPFLQGL
jgi:glyoxylase-like metal-dependent hydrolase (beta-lactamase superfamily II)